MNISSSYNSYRTEYSKSMAGSHSAQSEKTPASFADYMDKVTLSKQTASAHCGAARQPEQTQAQLPASETVDQGGNLPEKENNTWASGYTWGEAIGDGALDANGIINKDAWRRKYQEAIENDDYSTYMRLNNPDEPWVGISGLSFDVGSTEYYSSIDASISDRVRYEELFRKIHDEVLDELNLDASMLKTSDPEAKEALRMIGERLQADPLGNKLIQQMGMTEINKAGLPTALPLRGSDYQYIRDTERYEELFRKAHDEVIAKMGLDASKLGADDPRCQEVVREISERISGDPLGKELVKRLGMTEIIAFGLSTPLSV